MNCLPIEVVNQHIFHRTTYTIFRVQYPYITTKQIFHPFFIIQNKIIANTILDTGTS